MPQLRFIVLSLAVVLPASTVVALVTTVPVPVQYRLTDLGVLDPVRNRSVANDVNENGSVVGNSETSNGNRAFLWTPNGGMEPLGLLADGDLFSVANAINDLGQVVGQIRENQPFVPDRAVLWNTPNAPMNLGSLSTDPGARSFATDINNRGEVVGGSDFSSRTHAFRWKAVGGMVNLGQLVSGNRGSQATSINELGQVVGFGDVSATGQHAFLWTEQGGMDDIDDFPNDANRHSFARAINDLGEVAGDRAGQAGAFLWTSTGGMQPLGDLPGANELSLALDINNHGHVVGRGQTPQGDHAFIWSPGEGMLDLNQRLDASGSGWTLSQALGINDAGQIVGFGSNPFGRPDRSLERAFLLTPVPEPAAASLLFVALLGCWAVVVDKQTTLPFLPHLISVGVSTK